MQELEEDLGSTVREEIPRNDAEGDGKGIWSTVEKSTTYVAGVGRREIRNYLVK